MTILNTNTPQADVLSPDSPDSHDPPVNATPRTHIKIKILRQDGSSVTFSIKMTTPFDILMKTYCIKSDLPTNGVRLMFNGRQVSRLDTPLSLNMEEGDTLDAFHDFE